MRVNTSSGFTLIEVLIAIAIISVVFTQVAINNSTSLENISRSRRMSVVTMLAKNQMIESERVFQGKKFNEVKDEESGAFKAPFDLYKWTRTIKELKFPNIPLPGAGGESGGEDGGGGDASGEEGAPGSQDIAQILVRTLTKYLSDAVREVTVTVTWQKGSGTQSYSIVTYWVDLETEFKPQ